MSHAHSASLGIAVAIPDARCSKRGYRGARRDCPNERVVGRTRILDAALRWVLAASPGPAWKRRRQGEPKEDLNSPAAGPVPREGTESPVLSLAADAKSKGGEALRKKSVRITLTDGDAWSSWPAQARCAPGRPLATTNSARVFLGDPRRVTESSTR